MNITVTCSSCGQKLSAPENLAGRRVPCPKCKAPVDVPAAGPAAIVPAATRSNPSPPAMPASQPELDLLDLGLAEAAGPALPARSGPSRSARSAARPTKGLATPIIAAAVVLLFAVGGISAWLVLTSKGGAGSDLRYLPDDPDFIVSADVNGMISSGAGQKIKARVQEMVAAISRGLPKDSDIKPEDVGRITFGIRVQQQQGAGVVHLNRPASDQEFRDAEKNGKATTVGGYQAIITDKVLVCKIDDRTFLAGDDATVRKIIERNGPATISDELTAAVSEIDLSKSFAVAASFKNLAKMAGAGGTPMGPMAMPGVKDLRGGALQADVGNDIRLKAALLCKDAAGADQMKKMADAGVAMAKMSAGNPQMPPAAVKAMKILDTLEISNSGATLRASLTIDVDTIINLIPARLDKPTETSSVTESAELAPPVAPLPSRTGPGDAEPPAGVPAPVPPGRPAVRPMPKFSPGARASSPLSRMQASNNMKQIVLAMHSYAEKEKHFPPAAIYDPQGKPLLSWRVAIMPYLGAFEQNVHKQLHLDEPWDSTHNKRFVTMMPLVYGAPGGKPIARGKTCILAAVGEKVAFAGDQGRAMADFGDGLFNTILIVEAAPDRAVEWTRPSDLTIDESDPAAGLFGEREGGVLAGFGDGSVKFIPQTTGKDVIHALFTINGHEIVPTDF